MVNNRVSPSNQLEGLIKICTPEEQISPPHLLDSSSKRNDSSQSPSSKHENIIVFSEKEKRKAYQSPYQRYVVQSKRMSEKELEEANVEK